MKRIAVLVSKKGIGSNLRALIDAGFDIGLVIADSSDAVGIKIASENSLKSEVLPYQPVTSNKQKYRDEYSLKLANLLNENNIEIVVLAGFNRIITKPYFETFRGKTINIHPGAIPDSEDGIFTFEGEQIPWNKSMMTDLAVANFLTLKNASSTIHEVTEKADFGPVLKRVFVPVEVNDTVESLYGRLKKEENRGLVEVLNKLAS